MQLLLAMKKNPLVRLNAQVLFVCDTIKTAIDNFGADQQDVDYVTDFYFGSLQIQARGYCTGHFNVRCKTNSRIYYSTVEVGQKFDACWFLCKTGKWIVQVCDRNTDYRTVFDAANATCDYTKHFLLDDIITESFLRRGENIERTQGNYFE